MVSVRAFEQYGRENDTWLGEKCCTGLGHINNNRKNTNLKFIYISYKTNTTGHHKNINGKFIRMKYKTNAIEHKKICKYINSIITCVKYDLIDISVSFESTFTDVSIISFSMDNSDGRITSLTNH
jgi:hypothetical protein